MYKVKDLYQAHKETLQLDILFEGLGLARAIEVAEANRPGLSLAGFLKGHAMKRILVFGKVEMEYLKSLKEEEIDTRLGAILTKKTPACIVARNIAPPEKLIALCKENHIPLFKTPLTTMDFLGKLTRILQEEFAPTISCHGCLVDVFGVGILIQGDSAVGKSEAALGLIERGHQLISDDIVKVKRKEGSYLEGSGYELSRHHMEVRGIGIINVAHIYGLMCVRDQKSIDLVVKLEVWNDKNFYDRVGLDEKTIEMLEIKIPFHILPVKPGRDVVVLLETIALNHRLKKMGNHTAKEFQAKLLARMNSCKKL